MTRPRAILAFWLVCIAALGGWTAANLRIETDISQFLPRAVSKDDRVLLFQLREGAAARMLLLALGGGESVLARARASRQLAERLRSNPHFSGIANGDLEVLSRDRLDALYGYRYLIGPKSPCLDALGATGLREALRMRIDELTAPIPPLDKYRFASDPTACFREYLLGTIPSQVPERAHGVWFSPDRLQALMLVQTRADASDLAAQRAAVAEVREAFSTLPQADRLELDLAGPAFFAVGSEAAIRSEVLVLTLVASLLVVAILAFSFRSAALIVLGSLPLASGLLAGVVLNMALFGQLHGITLALGVTLLGVALDYPIHVFAHAMPGEDGEGVTGSGLWRTLLISAITTVLGYLALALTSFEGLAQLGVLSAAGLAVAALCARYLLPLLIPDGARLPERAWLKRVATSVPRPTAIAKALVLLGSTGLLVCVLLQTATPWSTDLSRLSTVPKDELLRDRLLRGQLGAPDVSRFLYAAGTDTESVLTRIESGLPALRALVEDGQIDGFDTAALWLPSADAQQGRQRRLPSPHALEEALRQAAAGSPFRESAFSPFLEAVERSRALPALELSLVAETVLAPRVSALLQPLDGFWIGLVPLSGIAGPEAVAALHEVAETNGLHYLDLREASSDLLARFMDNTLRKMFWAALVILVVLVVALGGMGRAAAVLLPILVSTSLALAALLLLEDGINLFHLVSLLLVVGLAIDYSLFFNRPIEDVRIRARTLLSVSVCALSSFAMFGMLALSDVPALHAIGLTVALGIAMSFPSALLLGCGKAETG